MAGSGGAVIPLGERRRRRQDVIAELREVEHWRRLVAARLDLAVAALTESPAPPTEGPTGPSGPPEDLRRAVRAVLGLPACADALPEVRMLPQLRETLAELDERCRLLRSCAGAPAPARRPTGGRTITKGSNPLQLVASNKQIVSD